MPQTAAFSAFTAPMASLVLMVPTVPVALLGCHSPGGNPSQDSEHSPSQENISSDLVRGEAPLLGQPLAAGVDLTS